MTIATFSAYIKTHERLLLACIAAGVLWFSIGHIEGIIAKHDDANLKQAQVTLATQASKDAALATQATEQAAQYKALADKINAQNAQLVAANTQLAAALTKQQKTDASLPLPDLANRWTALVPQAKPTATPTGLAVDTPGAVATVQALEQVPAQQKMLVNAQQELSNTNALLTASTGQVATLSSEVSGLRLENVDEQKVCTAQIAVVKAEARKSKRRWFYAGVIVGFLGRSAIK
jgi:hypothetical protein